MKSASDDIVCVPAEVLRGFVEQAYVALGTPPDDARICADMLLASDLRGIESHGVGRLKVNCERIQAGIQLVETEMEIVKETETTAMVDGHHGMGAVIAVRSMRLAMDKARLHGLGAVAVRNSTHIGIAGYYPLMAVREGMMGLALTNAGPYVTPTFGAEPVIGTNPIAFAAPSDGDFPFWFDAAMSIVSGGKIEALARAEKPAPEGWAIDTQGRTLTDPTEILRGHDVGEAMLLPLGGAGEATGGYKGFDLATAVEILCASLSGGAFLTDLTDRAPDGSRRSFKLGHFFLAIDIEHFVPLELSKGITGQIMRELQGARKAPGHDRIYVAGEKEHEREAIIRQRGIPLNRNLRRDLQTLRDELGITGCEPFL